MATTSNALIHALKIALISTGVVFIAFLLTPQLPEIWSSLRSWLRPPYLYVIINGIIITIAASSRLHHHYTHPPPHTPSSSSDDDNDEFRHIHTPSVDPYATKAAPEISPVPIPPLYCFNFSSFGAVMNYETTTHEAEEKAFAVKDFVPEKTRSYDLAEPESVYQSSAKDNVPEKPRNYGLAEPEAVNRRDYVVEKPKKVVFASVETRSTEAVNKRSACPPAPLARQETFDVVSSFFQTQIQEKPLLSARRPGLTTLDETATFGGVEKERNYKIATPPLAPLARQETSEMVSSFFQTQIEKPPPSARFGHNRRPTKAAPQGGKALRVAKPKRTETLESTWKTITEGRQLPLTRHLKKSDTWENHHREPDSSDPSMVPSPVKKSETFTDRTNYTAVAAAAATAKLKKDPSLSQDELNRRVEAFIKKVNEDMKLQRQQSMQQFMEMVNRATY